jgi:hypothetical protein
LNVDTIFNIALPFLTLAPIHKTKRTSSTAEKEENWLEYLSLTNGIPIFFLSPKANTPQLVDFMNAQEKTMPPFGFNNGFNNGFDPSNGYNPNDGYNNEYGNSFDGNMNVQPVPPAPSGSENLDVTISIGFLRGIFMQENNKVKDWQQHAELDSVKVVIIARNEANMRQADEFITSAPLEKPKPIGAWMNYTALFPLKNSNYPTKMTLHGLIQRDHSSGEYSSHGQYKRESIELFITLVFGNEAITLGRARLLVTGEETRTKQNDLPIDISRDGILKAQKKINFPMKQMTSLPSGKGGEIAPVAFKYDRRRRKFQIETDAVLRVFFKVSPYNPYDTSRNNNMNPSPSMVPDSNQSMFSSSKPRRSLFGGGASRGGSSARSRSRSNSVGPRNRGDVPSTVGGFSDGPRRSMAQPGPNGIPYQQSNPNFGGRPPSAQSNGIGSGIPPSPSSNGSRRSFHQQPSMNNMHDMSQSMNGSQMNGSHMNGSQMQHSYSSRRRAPSPSPSRSSNHSFHGPNHGRTGPPGGPQSGPISMNQRSQSAPRMRQDRGSFNGDQNSAYGGSSYGYSAAGNGMSRQGAPRRSSGHANPSRSHGSHGGGGQPASYGGSSYGGPRKMNFDQGHGHGGQGYGSSRGHSRTRSQSPYISRNF